MKKLLSILFLFAANFIFAQTSVTEEKGQEFKVVGNNIWRITHMETDSPLCDSVPEKNCLLKRTSYDNVEIISVDPQIPISENFQKITAAIDYGYVVMDTQDNYNIKKMSSWGMNYDHPTNRRLIHYSAKDRHVSIVRDEITNNEINGSSFLALLLLSVYSIIFYFAYFSAYDVRETYQCLSFLTGLFVALFIYNLNIISKDLAASAGHLCGSIFGGGIVDKKFVFNGLFGIIIGTIIFGILISILGKTKVIIFFDSSFRSKKELFRALLFIPFFMYLPIAAIQSDYITGLKMIAYLIILPGITVLVDIVKHFRSHGGLAMR